MAAHKLHITTAIIMVSLVIVLFLLFIMQQRALKPLHQFTSHEISQTILNEVNCKKTKTQPPEHMLVVARYNEDISWLSTHLGDFPSVVYVKNDTTALHNIEGNAGNEAPLYLRFILDNYYKLPKYTAFLHGHRSSWHMPDIVPLLRKLDWGKLGYMPLNIERFATIEPPNPEYYMIEWSWPTWFEKEMGPLPPSFNRYCCAQFVVDRDRILKHPIEFYQNLFDFLQSGSMDNFYSSRIFEHTWHYIFGDPFNVTRSLFNFTDITK